MTFCNKLDCFAIRKILVNLTNALFSRTSRKPNQGKYLRRHIQICTQKLFTITGAGRFSSYLGSQPIICSQWNPADFLNKPIFNLISNFLLVLSTSHSFTNETSHWHLNQKWSISDPKIGFLLLFLRLSPQLMTHHLVCFLLRSLSWI